MPKDLTTHEQDPEREYHHRLELLRAQEARLKHRHSILGYIKLAIFLLGVVAAVWILTSRIDLLYWVFLPALLFVFFAVRHERVIQSMSRCSRAISFYEFGLARIGNTWAGKGEKENAFQIHRTPTHETSTSSAPAHFSNWSVRRALGKAKRLWRSGCLRLPPRLKFCCATQA